MYRKDENFSNLSSISESIGESDTQDGCKTTKSDHATATFEEAIEATEFGKFNLILMMIAIPAGWANVFETTTMSYVFPAAQCDLDLSLEDKGLLNAATYVGMVSSGLIWGYLCDILGRKKLLVVGYFLDGLFVIIGSLSQSFEVLIVSKFLGGFVINGPFAAFTAYLSELHCAKYRARFQMVFGLALSIGTIVLPVIAQMVLPLPIDFTILNSLGIHSWNVYLFVTAIFPLLAGFIFLFLPESPKFLMTTGKNNQALEIFRLVYSLNTGKPRDTYPFKNLVDEKKDKEIDAENNLSHKEPMEKTNKKNKFFEGITVIGNLFVPPLLAKILLVCTLQTTIGLSLNTLRLWIPQLFQAINDYEYFNNGTSGDLCDMISVIRPKSNETIEKCVVITNNSQVYVNAMIIAGASAAGYVVAGSLINCLGRKKLLFALVSSGGVSAYSLYFASSKIITIILASINITVLGIALMVVVSVVVDLFPTNLRTIAVQLVLICGRIGSLSGNLLFPVLLKTGCAAPFTFIGTILMGGAFIDLFLPNTDMKAME